MSFGRLLKVGCLWPKKGAGGVIFLTGVLGKIDPRVVLKEGARIFVFQNKEKRGPKSPSHFLMSPIEDVESGGEEYDGGFGPL